MFISKLDQNDKTAIYFLALNENYLVYYDDFVANEGANLNEDLIDKEFGRELAYKIYNPKASGLDEDLIDKEFGRELAYKIYNPRVSGLDEDLNELLQNEISSFADDLDLSEIDESSLEQILETIENHCNLPESILIK